MPSECGSILQLDTLVTGYGKRQVINGISLDVAYGEIVSVIGHNGAGKSTLLKAAFGLLPIWKGSISLDGKRLQAPMCRESISEGVRLVLQGNRVFADLSVYENLMMGGITLHDRGRLREGIDRVLIQFPPLAARMRQRAGTLSGGEKQMLALGSALVLGPRLLLLDEPSLGLAPCVVSHVFELMQQIAKKDGISILIVEQKVREVLKIAHRVYVLRSGGVSFSGGVEALKDEVKLREVYL